MPKLEDFFRTQRAPKDYVSFPPQETPTLEKFFAERTAPKAPEANMFGKDFMASREYLKPQAEKEVKEVARPITPELQAIADVTPKVDSTRLQEIKTIFRQQPESVVSDQPMQETSQPQEQLSSRSDLIDVSKVRRQADELAPQASWGDVAMGLIPVAMDALSGGYGDALDVSGKYYMNKASGMEKRKQSLEDKLMEIERARSVASAKASGKDSQALFEVDVNGKPIRVDRATAIGKEAWKKPEENWKEKEAFKASLKDSVEFKKLSAKQQKDVMDREMALADDWSKDEFTKNTYKAADAFKRIAAINPESANPVEDMGAIFDLMKMLDPQSVVRESEQAMAMGARSYEDVISNFEDIMTRKRKLTGDQVRNIKKFAARLYNLRKESQAQIDSGYNKKAASYGLDASNIVQKIGSGTPLIWKNTKTGKWDVVVAPEGREEEYLSIGAQRIK